MSSTQRSREAPSGRTRGVRVRAAKVSVCSTVRVGRCVSASGAYCRSPR